MVKDEFSVESRSLDIVNEFADFEIEEMIEDLKQKYVNTYKPKDYDFVLSYLEMALTIAQSMPKIDF
jgi:hypothetical protein